MTNWWNISSRVKKNLLKCHEDYKTEKIQEAIKRLKTKNESLMFN